MLTALGCMLLAAIVAPHDLECVHPSDLGYELPSPDGCGDCLRLGIAAALCGDVAILADDGQRDGPPQPGFIAMYRLDSGAWERGETLVSPASLPGDLFGASIACDGARVLVGAPGDPIGGPPGGSAWLYTQSAKGWELSAHFSPSQPIPTAQFGSAVALHGEFVAVGTSRHDRDNALDVGRVEIFQSHGNSWRRVAVIDPKQTTTSLRFGSSLAFTDAGRILAIGAPGFDSPVDRAGALYLVDQDKNDEWAIYTILQRPEAERLDRFGSDICANSRYLMVGIPGSDYGASNAGALAILSAKHPIRILCQRIEPTTSEAYLGSRLACSPVLACATLPGATTADGQIGQVRLFAVNGSELVPLIDLRTFVETPSLGAAVAVDGWRLLVTAIGNEDGIRQPGRAWIIDLSHQFKALRNRVGPTVLVQP